MLRQCEFNGRKDVLHFKLLQAAINENNANKNSVKNPNQIVQKSVENSMLENNDDYDKHREIKTYHQKHARSKNSDQYDSDEEQCQFQSYHRDDVAYANEKKKKRISSSMVPLDPRSKRKCENPFMVKSKSTSQLKRPLPVSESRKALKNSHGMHRNALKIKKNR